MWQSASKIIELDLVFINPFVIIAMLLFYAPWKYQKTKGLLVFSGGIKWEHWAEMG